MKVGAGGDRWLTEIAPRLKKRGLYVEIIATDFIPISHKSDASLWYPNKICEEGIKYREISTYNISNLVNTPILKPTALQDLSHQMNNFDVTYFLNAYFLQDFQVFAAKIASCNRPIISAQHACMFQDNLLHNLYIRLVSRPLLKAFDTYHVLNQEDFRTYQHWGMRNVYLIPNGVDIDRFHPSQDDFNPSQKLRLLFVGRLDRQKGIDLLLQALEYIEHKYNCVIDDIICRIIGAGPLLGLVKKYASSKDYIEYLGYVTEDELLENYRKSDLFLMPSRRETFGLVAVEALSSGVPVLTTDIPGPRSFMSEQFGFIVKPNSAKLLAEGLVEFHRIWREEPDRINSMKSCARRCVEKNLSWESVVDRFVEMIQNTTN